MKLALKQLPRVRTGQGAFYIQLYCLRIQATLQIQFIQRRAEMCYTVATWSHKNTYLWVLFCKLIFTYLTACFAAVSNTTLKHGFNM